MTTTQTIETLKDKSPEELNVICAELCDTARTELGILYPNGTQSFGNSEEYTRRKCANYQRRGLGCQLIERRTTDENYATSYDAILGEVKRLSDDDAKTFYSILNAVTQKWTASPADLTRALILVKQTS